MKLPGKKRRAITWAVVVFIFGMFIFGLIWTVLYYGFLQPESVNVPAANPSAFDSLSLPFVQTFIAWWPFMVLTFYLFWLWIQSLKQRSSY